MKVKKLKVIKFRNLNNIEIDFASSLNAIAGQNGTSKTSILGLIGHIFNFTESKVGFSGKRFATQFSEIFKFAYPKYDKAGEHIWETELDDKRVIPAMSYSRKEKFKKDTIRVRVGKSARGSGKMHLPVIYLGMSRLFPLALEKNIKSGIISLSKEESQEFKKLHNEILLMDHDVLPEPVECSNKNFFAAVTEDYNHLGNSAGQDNVGQIITALMSFKRLQLSLAEKYPGGILLIDEIDASLFPAAQMKLIEKLYEKSLELNLQIFYTTHSLEVLSQTLKTKNSKITFLDKSFGKIQPLYNPDIDRIRRELLVLGPKGKQLLSFKKSLYCEDTEARDFLKNAIPNEMIKTVNVYSAGLSNNELKEIAKKKLPDLQGSVIVLDGDSHNGNINNVLTLPGSKSPDELIFDMLKSFPEDHDFWKLKDGYTRQFCFKNCMTLPASGKRRKLKEWYREQGTNWGINKKIVWKCWISLNEEIVRNFIVSLKNIA